MKLSLLKPFLAMIATIIMCGVLSATQTMPVKPVGIDTKNDSYKHVNEVKIVLVNTAFLK